jgi:hypothetical protein
MGTNIKQFTIKNVIAYALCALVLGFICTNSKADREEYVLKAAFLEKFTRFIEWPPDSRVSDPVVPFALCVFGNGLIEPSLHELSRLTTIKNKSIEIKSVTFVDQILQCDLLYIANLSGHDLSEIVAASRMQPILTVSDSPGFSHAGVMINFISDSNHIGFEINIEEAQSSGLKISSRLLKLARIVETGDRS